MYFGNTIDNRTDSGRISRLITRNSELISMSIKDVPSSTRNSRDTASTGVKNENIWAIGGSRSRVEIASNGGKIGGRLGDRVAKSMEVGVIRNRRRRSIIPWSGGVR